LGGEGEKREVPQCEATRVQEKEIIADAITPISVRGWQISVTEVKANSHHSAAS